MSRKVFIILVILVLITSPLFADDTIDSYVQGFTTAIQAIAMLIGAVFAIFCGLKIFSNGLNKDTIGYLVGVIAGIVIIVLAPSLPDWVKGLNKNVQLV